MWPLPLASGPHHLAPRTCPHCEWGGMGLGFEWRQRGQEPLGGDGEHPCPGLTQLGSGSQSNKNVPSPPSEHSTNDPSHRKPDSPRQCLAKDSQHRSLSLYPGPDNEAARGVWFCLRPSGSTSRARPGPGFSTFSRTENKDGPWSPYSCRLGD